MISTGDFVKFQASETQADAGRVTRVWDKPAADPYVTIKTDQGRTFVRCSSQVTVLASAAADRGAALALAQDKLMGH